MIKQPEFEYPKSVSSERASIAIDMVERRELAGNLRSLADGLWDTTLPDKRVMRFGGVPLDKEDLSDHFAFSNRRFNSLSAAYRHEGGNIHAGLVFLTPQLYDATRIDLRPDGEWDIILYDSEEPVGSMDNGEILDLLKAKLVHSISMFDFIDRLHHISDKDFPRELISHLQHMGDTRTELRTYSQELRPQVSSGILAAAGIRPPYYRPGMKIELMRSEGIEAVDYRLQCSAEDIQILMDTVNLDGENETVNIKNTYEFSFTVPYETDFPDELEASFIVSGNTDHKKLKQLAASTEPELKAADIFRNATVSLSQAKHPQP